MTCVCVCVLLHVQEFCVCVCVCVCETMIHDSAFVENSRICKTRRRSGRRRARWGRHWGLFARRVAARLLSASLHRSAPLSHPRKGNIYSACFLTRDTSATKSKLCTNHALKSKIICFTNGMSGQYGASANTSAPFRAVPPKCQIGDTNTFWSLVVGSQGVLETCFGVILPTCQLGHRTCES